MLALLATGLFQLIKPFTEIVWPNYLVLIHSVQQGYHTMLLDAVKQAQIEPVTASLTLIGLSFLYGIFMPQARSTEKLLSQPIFCPQETS